MKNEKTFTEDPYVIQLMKELEIEKEKSKNLEIELANKKREEITGKILLLEGVVSDV